MFHHCCPKHNLSLLGRNITQRVKRPLCLQGEEMLGYNVGCEIRGKESSGEAVALILGET